MMKCVNNGESDKNYFPATLYLRIEFALMAHSYNVVIVHFADDDTQRKGRVGLFLAGMSLLLRELSPVCSSSKGSHSPDYDMKHSLLCFVGETAKASCAQPMCF